MGQVAFRRLLLGQRTEIGIAVRGMRSRPEHKEFDPVGRVGGLVGLPTKLLPRTWYNEL
jgi:hypothetical protein